MTVIDWIAVITGLASIVLALVAIPLSLFFFIQSRSAEREASIALAEIKTQTHALESLTARWMDRFTRHATKDPKPDQVTLELLEQIKVFTAQRAPIPHQLSQTGIASQDTVDVAICLLYYVGLANFHTAGWVPDAANYDEDNAWQAMVLSHTDQSVADFRVVKETLDRADQAMIQNSTFKHLYDAALDVWHGMLRTSAQCFAERATRSNPDTVAVKSGTESEARDSQG